MRPRPALLQCNDKIRHDNFRDEMPGPRYLRRMTPSAVNKLTAEFLGTFIMVFAGTGAIVIDQAHGGVIGHVGVALTFGLVVMAMIHAFGDVSGAHMNPAVTLAFAVAGRFSWSAVAGYIVAQLAGAFAASGLLKLLFPASSTLGATLPSGSVGQSFVLEVVLTAMLMLTILSVSTGAREKGITAAIAIGSVVGLEAMFAGPVSGASMNPARSLAPAVVSGNFQHLWLYPAATGIGALLAVPLCRLVRGRYNA
jgi:aquaporin Z